MKKSNNRGSVVPMRKKTNAEKKSDNKRKLHTTAVVKAENEKPPMWEDLIGVYESCRLLLATPAHTAGLLNNRQMLLDMGENVTKLTEMTINLTNLVKDYNASLTSIFKTHNGRTGTVTDGGELMEMLTIGQEYQSWTDSFNTVVLSVVNDITSLAQSFIKQKVTEEAASNVGQ